MSRLPGPARRADRPPQRDPVHVRRQAGRGVRGRHRRLGAVRRRPAHVLAELQVPPPARAAVLRRPVPELHRRGRRRARRARVHRARPRGHAGRAPERPARARARRDARHGPRGDEVHAARLLLQDVHPPAQAVAGVREGAPARRRPRRAAQAAARARVADRVPPAPRRRARRRRRDRRAAGRRGRRRARATTSCWSTRGRSRSSRIAGVEILARASALGYFDGIVPVWQGDTLHQIRARRHVFATGAIEQPLVFAGNDLPGVMLSGGALRLTELYAVSPGARAVVATTSDRGLEAAAKLADAGVQIVAVADLRTERTAAARRLAERGIEVLDRPRDRRGEGRQGGPGRGARADRRRGRIGREDVRVRPRRRLGRVRAGDLAACSRPARGRATTPRADASCWTSCRRT